TARRSEERSVLLSSRIILSSRVFADNIMGHSGVPFRFLAIALDSLERSFGSRWAFGLGVPLRLATSSLQNLGSRYVASWTNQYAIGGGGERGHEDSKSQTEGEPLQCLVHVSFDGRLCRDD